MLGIGIDFGTSNCSVAIYDGSELRYVELEPGRDTPTVMPSALYLARDRSFEIGRDAIETYVSDNAGRSIRLTPEGVGAITVTVAGTDSTVGSDDGSITESFEVHALTDHEMPGRLFRGVKRWLANGAVDRVRVFEARYRIVALATPIMASLVNAAKRENKGKPAAPTCVGRPVRYESAGRDADSVAVERMEEICRNAGLQGARLYPEPAAAALSYLHRAHAFGGRDAVPNTLLAFDFGGGTLDLCVMRAKQGEFEILANHGIGIGGDEIDRQIFRAKVFPELGEGASVSRLGGAAIETVPFPFADYSDRLLNWMQTHELNRPERLEVVARGASQPGEDGARLERLRALIQGNHVYGLFRAIERAKVELSDGSSATIDVPEIDLEVDIDRAEFERIFESIRQEISRCLEETLERAGLAPDSVDTVIRTGGSSRIPSVIRLLEGVFPGRVVEHDPFTSIAAGLAIASLEAGA